MLVLFTTFGGMWLTGASLGVGRTVLLLGATFLVVGAANAFNCYLERSSDRFMARTALRPLPQGRMEPVVALVAAALMATVGLPLLVVWANPLTGALGALALLSYVLAYTPLKRRTEHAMLVGALPGALPPLMGWTAITGQVETPGLLLFAIMFLWQLPHFLAIALFRKDEYRAAGLTSVPLARGDRAARVQAVAYVVALLGVSVLPYFAKVAGPWYLAAAVALGLGFLAQAVRGAVQGLGARWARGLFGTSLLYVMGLFVALGVDGGPR
ncbi:MAG: heme o synthase [Myxococcaceae bacterium]|nr:heme o synthase [Myxococcaceae bacterium]